MAIMRRSRTATMISMVGAALSTASTQSTFSKASGSMEESPVLSSSFQAENKKAVDVPVNTKLEDLRKNLNWFLETKFSDPKLVAAANSVGVEQATVEKDIGSELQNFVRTWAKANNTSYDVALKFVEDLKMPEPASGDDKKSHEFKHIFCSFQGLIDNNKFAAKHCCTGHPAVAQPQTVVMQAPVAKPQTVVMQAPVEEGHRFVYHSHQLQTGQVSNHQQVVSQIVLTQPQAQMLQAQGQYIQPQAQLIQPQTGYVQPQTGYVQTQAHLVGTILHTPKAAPVEKKPVAAEVAPALPPKKPVSSSIRRSKISGSFSSSVTGTSFGSVSSSRSIRESSTRRRRHCYTIDKNARSHHVNKGDKITLNIDPVTIDGKKLFDLLAAGKLNEKSGLKTRETERSRTRKTGGKRTDKKVFDIAEEVTSAGSISSVSSDGLSYLR